jgi:hypothetical protein
MTDYEVLLKVTQKNIAKTTDSLGDGVNFQRNIKLRVETDQDFADIRSEYR